MCRVVRISVVAAITVAVACASPAMTARGAVTSEEVKRAIRSGVGYLKREQSDDGSWTNVEDRYHGGTTALVTLALLTAGERPDEPHVAKALAHLERFSADDLGWTYTVALQTMVFAQADPKRYGVRIAGNVRWLEQTQIRAGFTAGSWSYGTNRIQAGDNSNTQYAMLGLHAAQEAGQKVEPVVWRLARDYWERCQTLDGGWSYVATNLGATASMTCAGITSLIIAGTKPFEGREVLVGDEIRHCGQGGFNPSLQRGIDWMAAHLRVGENYGMGQQWRYYYLYGLERAGRLSGQRFFGGHDWYREGAERLVHDLQPRLDHWRGVGLEDNPILATSFAILFLAKGRAPIIINKLRHGPGGDWDNDPDDVRNLVGVVSRDWGPLLTWQIVDPASASVEDLLQAPILFFNGHKVPTFNERARANLREYVEQGGFLFADACCGSPEFDKGFRDLMKALFPEPEFELQPLPPEHAVWRAKWPLTPEVHPLWGIEHGCRTVVIYTPADLSCYWNQAESQPGNPAVEKALRVGQNVVDYATGRELPPDRLEVRQLTNFRLEAAPRRGALHIAKLKHAGDWNVAPLAVPNLTTSLRDHFQFDVVVNHREILPRDPNLIFYPLVYIHGRAAMEFSDQDRAALRRHLEPGGGTLFADAACGSPSFDASFRRFVEELLPGNPMVPIPRDDDIYTKKVGYDLADVQYSKGAGGGRDYPQLEGVKLNGRWAVIYSKYDIGCALERHLGLSCKGYDHEGAVRIASNIVIYATLP